MKIIVIAGVVVCVLLAGCAGVKKRGEHVLVCNAGLRIVRSCWRCRVQNEDGSWGKTPTWFKGEGHPGYTGLTLLTFLVRGETPLSEHHGKAIQDGMRWLHDYGMRKELASEIARHPNSVAAKSHAIATMALCESYSMTKIPFLKPAMERTVDILLTSQLPNGGFAPGLDPTGQWDTVLSVWCTRALLSAKVANPENAKLDVAFARAQTFFTKTCRMADGSYALRQAQPTETNDTVTVMGTAMFLTFKTDVEGEVRAAVKRLFDYRLPLLTKVDENAILWSSVDLATLEGLFFTSEFVHMRRVNRKLAKSWKRVTEGSLIRSQSADGYWELASNDGFEKGDGGGRLAPSMMCGWILDRPSWNSETFNPPWLEEEQTDNGGMVIDIGE